MISTTPDNLSMGTVGPLLENTPVKASAPCRIDFGGTLDISTFHYPLRIHRPATVNIALDQRTTVSLRPATDDRIWISSHGIAEAAFAPQAAPYDHPLGLMFAVADYFGAKGVHIGIHSTSPPQSGLGGSSVAAVALIAAFSKLGVTMGRSPIPRTQMVLLAHAIEQGVAGVPCGIQDQLAAAFGGVNCWGWPATADYPAFSRRPLADPSACAGLDRHLLVAYLGVTHVSKDVNQTWVRRFIGGKDRAVWQRIIELTHQFADALEAVDMRRAAAAMNEETALRKAMTPQVLESMGERLAAAAMDRQCGARFTGAGGGGCLWAMGEADAIAALKPVWETLLAERPTAGLIDCRVDSQGVV
ncbi:galactokinase [Desulfosarcina variabilis]|uniref:GHMP family kinase ATP-binding protein n=1 Tax=Desulfosarcina variabilis TaxID=2300 RepID=UPI003AFB2B53